jgi:hypothetical protein
MAIHLTPCRLLAALQVTLVASNHEARLRRVRWLERTELNLSQMHAGLVCVNVSDSRASYSSGGCARLRKAVAAYTAWWLIAR